jgi:hypothetical protein
MNMVSKKMVKVIFVVCLFSVFGTSSAVLVDFNGTSVDIDGWVGAAAGDNICETIVLIDWNICNGPYATASHAWGYRWESSEVQYVANALNAIDTAFSSFTMTTSSGGAFIDDIFYDDGVDNHTTVGRSGWWWTGQSLDGINWTDNSDGITAVTIADGQFQGLNIDASGWGGVPTLPIPEPTSILLLAAGGLFFRRRLI